MAGNGKNKSSPAQLDTDEKQIKALNLRKAGIGFREIAETVGYSGPSSAYAAVMSALAKARKEPAEELRTLMLDRLDEMFTGVWEAAITGDPEAINAALRIEERRARLLGLDKPMPLVQMAVGKVTVGDIDFSNMTNDQLREHIQREMENHGNGDNGTDAAGTGEA